ncbi:microsomal signal peptidase 25 kDa subunit [Basidiobolus meristosporus CBS 931.73]|uniref:Signal peptidase complex subunit 2 n=1 Tax=Basidiobolus meristosporus CBS 931.73 TaxID=1314790 RepID=A0A1Y1XQR0_9FUNG|nr:microsomal signal peptidase 25 kDa subunit [Basidiobolus meristosporus CBS 931.73]|eukprot:ORX87836.1 microsomal signal peptidase 25 kDa subunit [Basidiobolus meristosporus CBS 931.73]
MTEKVTKDDQPETFQELPVVNNGSISELRIACDEALPKFLTKKLGYQESHQHNDIKLLFGYIACAFAGISVYVSYKMSFEDSKLIVAGCVLGYFIFSSAMTLYTWKIQKNVVFVGVNKESNLKLEVGVLTKAYNPIYQLSMKLTDPKSGKSVEQQINQSFAAWFDQVGHFAEDLFNHDVELLLSQCEGKLQN